MAIAILWLKKSTPRNTRVMKKIYIPKFSDINVFKYISIKQIKKRVKVIEMSFNNFIFLLV